MLDPHMTGDWSIDAKLLDAWRAGDQAAGSQLFDRHADAVARFFGNKVTTGAEDLVQQTFLVLIENRERIREGLTFRAFVLGVARNVLRGHLRKLARGREVDPEVEAMTDLAPGVSTIVGQNHEQRLLLEGLRRLPIEHQIALELHYWEDMDAREIAELMGVSHSAMRSRLAKARALLRDAITRLAKSPQLRASTLDGLAQWATQLRAQLGARLQK